ncbi:hypothetical protein M413DRAFT_445666 [Hebeloma cylindrosporum]|uniref:Uncharacterized protein n=1 Tax=Hebeloma cylindrosporum TaxID=76867 RepID=A0A0C3C9J6_HEBCY|nr:hypothetical protein M413DRAFT_445666 [Hebeloma cylindrosporum h7]
MLTKLLNKIEKSRKKKVERLESTEIRQSQVTPSSGVLDQLLSPAEEVTEESGSDYQSLTQCAVGPISHLASPNLTMFIEM